VITLLCGTIGSGKSSFTKTQCSISPLTFCLNDDALITMLHGGNYSYNKSIEQVYKIIENSIIDKVLGCGLSLIIDKTCLNKKSRQRYIDFAKTYKQKINCIVFPIESPEIHARRRYEHDNRSLSYEKWLSVAQEHISKYEEPSIKEGFNEIIRYSRELS
jgi:predicted kinase